MEERDTNLKTGIRVKMQNSVPRMPSMGPSDKELNDLLDFSAMFSPPTGTGGKPGGTSTVPMSHCGPGTVRPVRPAGTVRSAGPGVPPSPTGPAGQASTYKAGIDGPGNTWNNQQSPSFDSRGYEHSHSTTYGNMNDRIMEGLPNSYTHSSSAMSSIMGKSKDPYSMPYQSMSRDSNLTPNANVAIGMSALTSDMSSGSSLSPHTKPGSPYYYSPHPRRRPLVPEHPTFAGPHKRRKGPAGGLTVYSPNGQDEYHHSSDPSSYPSPKPPGLYPNEYFMDATSGTHSPHSTDPWNGNGLAPSSASFHSTSILGNSGSSYSQSQTTGTYPPHEPMGYGQSQSGGHVQSHTLSPSRDPLSLPPMSTFRPGTTTSSTHPHSPYSTSSPTNGTDTTLSVRGTTNVASGGGGNSQTGDTLGKALASIYPTDHTSSSFPSNPSTPVGSPPPMSGPWPRSSTQASPGPYHESHLHSLQSRMEERLDDAINVLQRHAEGALQAMPNHPAGMVPPPAHTGAAAAISVGPSFAPPGQYIDPHMSGSPSVERNAVAGPVSASEMSQTQQPFNAGVQGEMMSQSMDTDHKPTPKPKKPKTSPSSDTKLKLNNSKDTQSKMAECEDPSTTQSTRKETVAASKSKKQYDEFTSVSGDESGDDSLTPEQKLLKEKERRHANNARERIRVRDINEAFKELGRMTCLHLKSDKAQTKLSILHQAVSVITSLEQQVRERNLNPKAACLKRREEEKVEERNMGGAGGGPPSSDSINSPPGMGSRKSVLLGRDILPLNQAAEG
ncbi:transcription factor 12-like isoform X4 [Acanthaster planci]|uniref:Transcription factor 12-like isoform X4 n=1 Tax=Acanthaster planci TaxID=133434 RepID=A0A8B7Y480_ACAPL|nr:transcription factor 12-like isoform X4 [Acanthaster planci]